MTAPSRSHRPGNGWGGAKVPGPGKASQARHEHDRWADLGHTGRQPHPPEDNAMITKFTTVYAGHVDLADRGQDATPANERRLSNEHLASVFAKTEAIARTMDKLG